MRVCLFDWDGTILDVMPIWHETVGRLFQKYGKRSMAPSIGDFFRELTVHQGDYSRVYQSRGLNVSREELVENFASIFIDLAARSDLKLIANAEDTLTKLDCAGVILGLVTTQHENIAMPLLKKFDLLHLFRHLKFHAIDKKKAIEIVLLHEGVHPRDCYYVGDAPSDIRHANNAGVISVAYLGGYVPEELLMSAKPSITIKDFRELLSFV